MSINEYISLLGAMTTQERHRHLEHEQLPPNVGSLLDTATKDCPERDAWNFFEGAGSRTYRKLQSDVGRTANALRSWGVTKGTHVAVMLPNIPEMPTIWLALAKLGAIMVPVNIRYTARELRYVLEDGRVEYLIIHTEYEPQVSQLGEAGEVQPVNDERIAVVHANKDARHQSFDRIVESSDQHFEPIDCVGLDDVLNIQYTSGTTGFPKGCLLTHRYWLTSGLVNGFRDGKRFERVLAPTPFFYLDPQWLLLVAFYQRGTLYVAERQSATRFASWLRKYQINFCLFPEAAFKQPPHPDDGNTVVARANIYGLRKEIHAELRQRFNVPAMEAFGMTETGPCLYVPLEHAEMIGSGSCGIPAPHRSCRVVDENGQDVPVGAVGELVVRGPGIMSGYYEKPQANQASYFGDWFRTGDLFRKDERGFHYIVGRLKDMVRRSSENIAAREVEAVLRGLPEVLEAAIVPVPDSLRGEEVKAFIVLQPEAREKGLPLEKLFAYCEEQLASFKVPRYVEFIDALPKTPSEKIAKGALLKSRTDLRAGSYDRVTGSWV